MSLMQDTSLLEQGSHKKTGTVLLRKTGRSGDSVLLFLRSVGPLWAYTGAPSSRKKFGNSVDPLNWGVFELYQGVRSTTVRSLQVKEDFLPIRRSYSRLVTALEWGKLLSKQLSPACEQDEILLLYWNALKQLSTLASARVVEFRFLWRWAKIVGLAPSLTHCSGCGKKLESAYCLPDALLCPDCEAVKGLFVCRENLLRMQASALSATEQFFKLKNLQIGEWPSEWNHWIQQLICTNSLR